MRSETLPMPALAFRERLYLIFLQLARLSPASGRAS
jgi:hypothetical protein